MKVPTKGSHVPFVGKTIIFTSNVHPREWYDFINKPQMHLAALMRRITTIEEMNTPFFP